MAVFKEKSRESKQLSPTLRRSVHHLENLMVTICDFTNGPAAEPDPPHSHPHEQIGYVAEGELFLFIDGQRSHLITGDLFTIPSGIPHCIQTISPIVRLIDSFCPVREDFLEQKG